jgi:hypothetical protein
MRCSRAIAALAGGAAVLAAAAAASAQPGDRSTGAAPASATIVAIMGAAEVPPLALDLDAAIGPGRAAPRRSAAVQVFAPADASFGLALPAAVRLGNGLAVVRFDANMPLAGELVMGHHALDVGATFQVSRDLPPGTYAGTFDLTILNN